MRRYRAVITIETDQDPSRWTLENFHASIQNGEADEVGRGVVKYVADDGETTTPGPNRPPF